jgi:serine/threonine protein kinase
LNKWFAGREKMPEGTQVYKFVDSDGSTKIVKIYDKTSTNMMTHYNRELAILKAIEKECDLYFVCFTEVKEDAQNYYIVTKFLSGFMDGFDLQWKIHHKQLLLSHSEYLQLFCALIKALLKLHNLGVAHNDIKPGNFMVKILTDENKHLHFDVRFIDFGQACIKDKCWIYPGATPMYRPPEFYQKGKYATHGHFFDFNLAKKADYWALGLTCLELLLGNQYHTLWWYKYKRNPDEWLAPIARQERVNQAASHHLAEMKHILNFMEFMPRNFPSTMPNIFNLLTNMLQVDPEKRNIPEEFIELCKPKKEEITPSPMDTSDT